MKSHIDRVAGPFDWRDLHVKLAGAPWNNPPSLSPLALHLRDVHQLPVDLIDLDDFNGMYADHIYLHSGRIVGDRIEWDPSGG